jgi:hypothetical protein
MDDKKGARSAMAQSKQQTTGKCVPARLEEAPEGTPHPTIPNVFATRVLFGLKRKEAAAWLAKRAMGIVENCLTQEMRAFQKERARHEMIVSMELEMLETGKTCRVNALLDNGYTAMCMDRDYTKAQGFEMKELDSAIMARNADRTPNTKGRITHYIELIMSLGSHRERQKFLITGLGKARLFISYDWLFKHNPEINWRDQKIAFSRCPEECNMSGTETQEGVGKDDL